MRRSHSVLLLALLVLAWAGFASAQQAKTPSLIDPGPALPEREQIQESRISSLTAWTYEAGPSGALGEGYRVSRTEFDREGNTLEQTSFDRDGSVMQRAVNAYDEAGFLVECVNEERSGVGDSRNVFEYDGELLMGTTSYRPDGTLLVRTTCEYDVYDQLTATTTEIPELDIVQRLVFEYDEDGNAIAAATYDQDGDVVASSATIYDENGWPVESTGYLPDGSVSSVTVYTYDDAGHITELVVTKADGTVVQTVLNSYDADGRVVETVTSNPAAGVEYRVEIEYDESGNRVVERTYNKLGQLVGERRYVYEYHPGEPAEQGD